MQEEQKMEVVEVKSRDRNERNWRNRSS